MFLNIFIEPVFFSSLRTLCYFRAGNLKKQNKTNNIELLVKVNLKAAFPKLCFQAQFHKCG